MSKDQHDNTGRGSAYRYRGAYVAVTLHDEQMREFLETWKTAKASGVDLPAVDDPDYASYDALLTHVFRWARTYLYWVCEQLGLPDPGVRSAPDAAVIESEAAGYLGELLGAWREFLVDVDRGRFFKPEYKAPWGVLFSVDAMLEHAVMHPLRHRFQLEELIGKRPG